MEAIMCTCFGFETVGEAERELLPTLSAKLITSMELNLCFNRASEQELSFMCRFLQKNL
jgi:hypothetical protein